MSRQRFASHHTHPELSLPSPIMFLLTSNWTTPPPTITPRWRRLIRRETQLIGQAVSEHRAICSVMCAVNSDAGSRPVSGTPEGAYRCRMRRAAAPHRSTVSAAAEPLGTAFYLTEQETVEVFSYSGLSFSCRFLPSVNSTVPNSLFRK